MVARKIQFELRNAPSESDTLSEKMEAFGESLDISKKSLFQVCFALDELFTNVISYGFCDGGEHTIRIALSLEDDVLNIVMEDDARPFNLNEVEPPNTRTPCENRKIGGLGIFLTKNLMDSVDYRRSGDKNIVTMKKRIGNDAEYVDVECKQKCDGDR
ncbi:MAG: ATP-binding protein [Desulfobacterales bacterium]|nr:ATP-binding protein [Desulfobacterales bacterium]